MNGVFCRWKTVRLCDWSFVSWDERVACNRRVLHMGLQDSCTSDGLNPEDPHEKVMWSQMREVVTKGLDARKLKLKEEGLVWELG